MNKITAQEFADQKFPPEFRQPLKTVTDAMAVHGWPNVDRPECCGEPIEIRSFIGCPYLGYCNHCRKFVASVDAPNWGNSWVQTIDSNKVDLDTDKLWIAGTAPKEEAA